VATVTYIGWVLLNLTFCLFRTVNFASVEIMKTSYCCVMAATKDTICTVSNPKWTWYQKETGTATNARTKHLVKGTVSFVENAQ